MKKKIFIYLLLLLVFFPIVKSLCCDDGCYPTSNICCGTPSKGYVGCYDINIDTYACPDSALGECLKCVCISTTAECSWEPATSGSCNGCEVTYDNEGFPIDSECSTSCPSGTTKCADGSCQENCNVLPPCLNTNDGCCNANLDSVCDPNCIAGQDPDCSGISPPISHSECSNQQCVQVSGEGIDLCTSNANCVGVPPTPSHKACGANGDCLTISGAGTDTCTLDSQCTLPPPGILPSHSECSNQQCVQVSGEGIDLCTSNANCVGVPPTPSHKACGANGNCISVAGAGTNTCTLDSQCTLPPGTFPFHAECNTNQQCVQVSGEGIDLCTSNANCVGVPPTPSHKACGANGDCLTISGAGTDTCSNNAQCLVLPPPGENPSYKLCNIVLKCIDISGLGVDQCVIDGTCVGKPTTPNHKVCSAGGTCVSVIGAGTNTCTSDSQCTLPPPGGVTCTKNEGDCCYPMNDGICDLDCIPEIDPDCQTYGTSGNDGICVAITDSICDINCISGVDMPDCTGFIATKDPNDGCFPLIDDECDSDCPPSLDPECSYIPGYAKCSNNGDCEDFESCLCNDCIEDPTSTCISGLFCCSGVCSGDVDDDFICDYDDYCINVYDINEDPENQEDTDEDCFINLERSLMFGNCGDACDLDEACFDIYGSKQCCDDIPSSEPSGSFLGYTSDCPKISETSIGCWSKCIQTDEEGNIITFEIGQCIEGTRAITKLLNNNPIEIYEEPCTSIPLIPFYTNLSIILTLAILAVYYIKRK